MYLVDEKREMVRKYYDMVARGYFHARWFERKENLFDYMMTKRVLEKELTSRSRADEILEIGCGPGVWTDLFASICKRVTAIDLSQKMISEAKKHIASENVRFICGDFMEHEFNQQFDLIISVRCIEYIQNKQFFLEKCSKLLKPHGKLVIVTKNPRSIWVIRQLYSFLIRKVLLPVEYRDAKRIVEFAKIDIGTIPWDKLRSILLETGFSKIRMKLVVFRPPLMPLKDFMFNLFAKINDILSNSNIFLLFSESYLITGIKGG